MSLARNQVAVMSQKQQQSHLKMIKLFGSLKAVATKRGDMLNTHLVDQQISTKFLKDFGQSSVIASNQEQRPQQVAQPENFLASKQHSQPNQPSTLKLSWISNEPTEVSNFSSRQTVLKSPPFPVFQPDPQAQDQPLAQHQQQKQRVNYCTICNKELCNKYFMRTHMLKMHGINLELEDFVDDDEDSLCGSSSEPERPHLIDKRNYSKKQRQPTSKRKFRLDGTTSVKNGFAGNSMGGVVCDICNKELCSKYFLKVHKQNTHGVVTDYQDLSRQFLLPFNAALQQNLVIHPALIPAPLLQQNQLGRLPLGYTLPAPSSQIYGTNRQCITGNYDQFTTQKQFNIIDLNKLIGSQKQEKITKNASQIETNIKERNLESFYKQLILGQKLQHTLGCNVFPVRDPKQTDSYGTLKGSMKTLENSYAPVDSPRVANASTGAGLSPAVVVDFILRNQHLVYRKDKPSTSSLSKAKDLFPSSRSSQKSDSKNMKNIQFPNNKNRKSANTRSNDYYTEACPMCDRKFKSIKWLKTHMMNDHKEEIQLCMQTIFQSCMHQDKSQQVSNETALDHLPISWYFPHGCGSLTSHSQQMHREQTAFMHLFQADLQQQSQFSLDKLPIHLYDGDLKQPRPDNLEAADLSCSTMKKARGEEGIQLRPGTNLLLVHDSTNKQHSNHIKVSDNVKPAITFDCLIERRNDLTDDENSKNDCNRNVTRGKQS